MICTNNSLEAVSFNYSTYLGLMRYLSKLCEGEDVQEKRTAISRMTDTLSIRYNFSLEPVKYFRIVMTIDLE